MMRQATCHIRLMGHVPGAESNIALMNMPHTGIDGAA